ncbi:phosphoadenylyl-sulfate reductase [Streptacidiphilus sp. PB12-B1b]|uniref:phosphoadenylyl-sulfate reductase n=1 Tax=Streptacidiphilus sp. PB12-B1b TaxID=2705012 RepID=UPI0015FD4CA4|nr:phosphoadenylyl-sulfate reductase [Streptacidiphilus sp. PB12-B1b]QMU76613.1 phosphoadenylyl-sulfate reductase [Streptacidiphilus sp. PB12-B1b]
MEKRANAEEESTASPPISAAELRALADEADARLSEADAADIVSWAHHTFGPRLVVASSMADTHLVHLAQAVAPGVAVLFLDTGYHFAETVGTRDAVAQAYRVDLLSLTPRQTVAEQDAAHGPRLYERDPDLCCSLRKVEPLERGLLPYTAWITGMRRADSPGRARLRVVAHDAARGMVKISPLARWTEDDVQSYTARHGVLTHPLLSEGYTSIGCQPCTRRPLPGAGARSGRWAGRAKTECGLHP